MKKLVQKRKLTQEETRTRAEDFFEETEEDRGLFFAGLTNNLKEKGLLVPYRMVPKIYTVSTQLFHRLWWNESDNRSRRYISSLQGESYQDLLVRYRVLRGFPKCLADLQEALRYFFIMRGHEVCESLGIASDLELFEVKNLIKEELEKDFPKIEDTIESIKNIKKISGGFEKRSKKKSLKKNSIMNIVIPIVWNNLLRDFISNPSSLICF